MSSLILRRKILQKQTLLFPTCSLHDGGKAAAGERAGPVQARPARPGGRPRLHRSLAARPCSNRDGPHMPLPRCRLS
jgi:hypothetical protein